MRGESFESMFRIMHLCYGFNIYQLLYKKYTVIKKNLYCTIRLCRWTRNICRGRGNAVRYTHTHTTCKIKIKFGRNCFSDKIYLNLCAQCII